MSTVLLEIEPPLARITLDRPPLNVIDLGMAGELCRALESVRERDDVAVVHLAARGKAFCAGVDVRDHLPDRGADMLRAFDRACVLLLELGPVVTASVQGAALGGGMELALCCDFVWASTAASFGQPEIKLGVFPPVAAVALPAMVGTRLAYDLVLTGRTLSAAEALSAGIVSAVAEPGGLEAAARARLGELLALSPSSLKATKRALALSRARPRAVDIEAAEKLYLDALLHDPDAIEGLTAFLEKRPAVWGAR